MYVSPAVAIGHLDEIRTMQTVNIEHAHKYLVCWPMRSTLLVCIGHALSMPGCIYVNIIEHTIASHT